MNLPADFQSWAAPRQSRIESFLENVLPLGTPGNAWSSGTILFLNMTVGLAVAAGFVELLSVFVEEVLRRET